MRLPHDLRAELGPFWVSDEALVLEPENVEAGFVVPAGASRLNFGCAEVSLHQDLVPKERVHLIYGYVKSEREDLTPQQIGVLAELMKELKDG
jgi:hypothetical protein